MSYNHFFKQLIYDIFCTSLAVYALSLIVETVKKGSILTVIDLNLLLIIAIVSGIVTMLFPIQRPLKTYGMFDGILSFLVAAALALTVFRAIENSGTWWALLLALGAGSMAMAIPFFAREK